jgi:hypothetical protein
MWSYQPPQSSRSNPGTDGTKSGCQLPVLGSQFSVCFGKRELGRIASRLTQVSETTRPGAPGCSSRENSRSLHSASRPLWGWEAPVGMTIGRESKSFAPAGAGSVPAFTHGLRRGLHSYAALRLKPAIFCSFSGGIWVSWRNPGLKTARPGAPSLQGAQDFNGRLFYLNLHELSISRAAERL